MNMQKFITLFIVSVKFVKMQNINKTYFAKNH